MNAIQLRKNVNSKTVAIIVFGACENHGDHMPFGSDFFVPMELARRVASHASNVLLLPITLINAIENICSSLIKNGISRILIINGHDGNIAPIQLSARTLKDKYPDVIIGCLEAWWTVIGQISKDVFDDWNGLGHGGEAETSAMLSVRSDLVDMKNAPEKIIPANIRIYWRFNEVTQTGATGATRKATRAKGDKILEVLFKKFLFPILPKKILVMIKSHTKHTFPTRVHHNGCVNIIRYLYDVCRNIIKHCEFCLNMRRDSHK